MLKRDASLLYAETFEILHSHKEAIVSAATELLGSISVRYANVHPELGQSLETGFDCSGLVKFVLTQVGLHIPDYIGQDDIRRPIRHANEFWDHYGINVGSEPEGGDLIFFTHHGLFPTHMGIVRDGESYIHAPGRDGTRVEVSGIEGGDVETRSNAGRVLYPLNPVGYKAPTTVRVNPTYRWHQQLVE
jgi:cell wall-associated NlpC family hydrolase